MEKIKYVVMQGNFTESGTGNFWEVGSFDTLEEARECFDNVKFDINGISKYYKGYLETTIEWYDSDNDLYIYEDLYDYHY